MDNHSSGLEPKAQRATLSGLFKKVASIGNIKNVLRASSSFAQTALPGLVLGGELSDPVGGVLAVPTILFGGTLAFTRAFDNEIRPMSGFAAAALGALSVTATANPNAVATPLNAVAVSLLVTAGLAYATNRLSKEKNSPEDHKTNMLGYASGLLAGGGAVAGVLSFRLMA